MLSKNYVKLDCHFFSVDSIRDEGVKTHQKLKRTNCVFYTVINNFINILATYFSFVIKLLNKLRLIEQLNIFKGKNRQFCFLQNLLKYIALCLVSVKFYIIFTNSMSENKSLKCVYLEVTPEELSIFRTTPWIF